MRLTTSLFLSALMAVACSRRSERATTPPPSTPQGTSQKATTPLGGTQHTDYGTEEEMGGPAPGLRSAPGQPAEEKKMEATEGTEVQRVGGSMSEANVIAALVASNEGEVKMGELMAKQTRRPMIRTFATMLVEDHGAALKKLKDLHDKSGIEGRENDAIRKMRDDAQANLDRLRGLSGDELDRAFLEMAIDGHRKTLERIDGELLPAARTDDLRTFLTEVRPKVQHHLDEAQRLLQKLPPAR